MSETRIPLAPGWYALVAEAYYGREREIDVRWLRPPAVGVTGTVDSHGDTVWVPVVVHPDGRYVTTPRELIEGLREDGGGVTYVGLIHDDVLPIDDDEREQAAALAVSQLQRSGVAHGEAAA